MTITNSCCSNCLHYHFLHLSWLLTFALWQRIHIWFTRCPQNWPFFGWQCKLYFQFCVKWMELSSTILIYCAKNFPSSTPPTNSCSLSSVTVLENSDCLFCLHYCLSTAFLSRFRTSSLQGANKLQGSVHEFPWGHRDAYNSNPLTDTPFTGKTRRYDFNIARGKISPDGYG